MTRINTEVANGFSQYNEKAFDTMLRQKKLDKQYISQVKISGIDDINGFKCSSGEVTN